GHPPRHPGGDAAPHRIRRGARAGDGGHHRRRRASTPHHPGCAPPLIPQRALAMPSIPGLTLLLTAALATSAAAQRAAPSRPPVADRAVYLDKEGVVRWKDTRQEVSLFGANYVLTTASDYRAAGYLHADRKAMITEDMA